MKKLLMLTALVAVTCVSFAQNGWSGGLAFRFKNSEWSQTIIAPPVKSFVDIGGFHGLSFDVRPLGGLSDGNGALGGIIMPQRGLDLTTMLKLKTSKHFLLNGGLYGLYTSNKPTVTGVVVMLEIK